MLEKCALLELSKISDPRGDLTFIEKTELPFDIQRVYYIYNVSKGAARAGHAHKQLQQLMIATSGSFDVLLDDGYQRKKLQLNRPNQGLYICPGIWRELENFSPHAVCMVLASQPYNESDYYRDYGVFSQSVRGEIKPASF